ncbi:MAG: ferrous iron transport protein A [Oscillospiraceae bacterium]|nr:ferrous iron transport protein A [Oscillospiraceae bacterium]
MQNLYDSEKNGDFEILSIPEIGLLENIGLRAGTKVTVQNRYVFGGPMLLRVEDTYSVAIGKDIAVQIKVAEVGTANKKTPIAATVRKSVTI